MTELSHPEFRRREQALDWVRAVALLPITGEVRGLGKILVREKVTPGPVAGDAVHVGAATLHAMESFTDLERPASGEPQQDRSPAEGMRQGWARSATYCNARFVVGG